MIEFLFYIISGANVGAIGIGFFFLKRFCELEDEEWAKQRKMIDLEIKLLNDKIEGVKKYGKITMA